MGECITKHVKEKVIKLDFEGSTPLIEIIRLYITEDNFAKHLG